MTLQKAKIRNLDFPDEEPIEVQFNPTELTFSKNAQFAEIAVPGLDAPIQQFIRGGTETFSIELFFDTTESGMGNNAVSVTPRVNQFYQLVKQNPATHAPPKCLFIWGSPERQEEAETAGLVFEMEYEGEGGTERQLALVEEVSSAPYWFTFVVESIERRFLLFSPEGTPLRARLTVRMREYQTLEQMVAKLESADHTRTRIFKRRERLDRLSNQLYNTPAEWRRIAAANGIDDPRRIQPGTVLQIPPMRVPSAIRRT
jgi:hypothetical protein